jgi:hypothetical protein
LFPFTYLERESEDTVVITLAQCDVTGVEGHLGSTPVALSPRFVMGYWDRVVVVGGYGHGLNGKELRFQVSMISEMMWHAPLWPLMQPLIKASCT